MAVTPAELTDLTLHVDLGSVKCNVGVTILAVEMSSGVRRHARAGLAVYSNLGAWAPHLPILVTKCLAFGSTP